jgi:Phosphoesterase family
LNGRLTYLLVACLVLAALVACGGGAPASQPNPQPNPMSSTITSVAVACNPATVAPAATSQCSATVQGTGNYSSAVAWSASAGTINSSGLFTAPASAGSITVTATSTQDTTKSGTAAVTVQSPSTITSVAVTCNPSTVAPTATSQCGATVQGTGNYSSAVVWSASAGAINSSGLFTAPVAAGNVTVTATSTQDTTKSGMATITVQSAPPIITSVAVTCSPSSIVPSSTSQCSATVQGTGNYSSAVAWSASAGAINSSGLFTAPAAAGSVRVTATSTQDTTKSGTATVTVQSPPTITSVAVACNPSTVAPSSTSQCSATVQGTGSYSSAVAWSASAGTIDSSGLFTAPATEGSVTVTATSTLDTTKSGTASVTVQLQIPQSKHVIMVMEENQSYSTVAGNTSAWPNLNNLISNGALPTNYYADSHPSIGNYFMLTTGQLLTTDDNSTAIWNVDNLARRMLGSGISFKVYAEGITQGYLGGNTGLYLIRHNPFAMLSDVADNPQVANQCIWPFSQFAADLAKGALPEFSFIVPDVDDDAHDGTPQQADAWLQANIITPLSSSSEFQPGGDGVLIVNFDEAATSDTTYGGGHVAPVLWGPNVKAGYLQTSTTLYQHESMLRTVMEALGLPNPPGVGAQAPSMAEFFVQK